VVGANAEAGGTVSGYVWRNIIQPESNIFKFARWKKSGVNSCVGVAHCRHSADSEWKVTDERA
jgi:hypothetical protein